MVYDGQVISAGILSYSCIQLNLSRLALDLGKQYIPRPDAAEHLIRATLLA